MDLRRKILLLKQSYQFPILYTKVQRKAITERKNDKYFNISFKYHEAYALEAILRHFISSSDYKNFDSYVVNTAHSVANSIHKEL